MQELRCLFALMVGSTRRFVDPSAAVELLREAFRTSEAQQVQEIHKRRVLCMKMPCQFYFIFLFKSIRFQDVSEFSHKLLDWLEDAFQLAGNGE